jgi:hypothetical protein
MNFFGMNIKFDFLHALYFYFVMCVVYVLCVFIMCSLLSVSFM